MTYLCITKLLRSPGWNPLGPLSQGKKMGLFHLTGLTESIGFCEGYNQ
jgi:hypothetical protein